MLRGASCPGLLSLRRLRSRRLVSRNPATRQNDKNESVAVWRLSYHAGFRFDLDMSRCGLTDFEWRVIRPLLPSKPRGAPRVDDRRVLNGIFWVLRSGAP